MEGILNLLWLLVAVSTLGLWFVRTGSHRITQRYLLTQAVALGCALALLFPVISVTDDLHPSIVALEASGKRRNCQIVSGERRHSPAPTLPAMLGSLTGSALVVPGSRFVGTVFLHAPSYSFLGGLTLSGRSPPAR